MGNRGSRMRNGDDPYSAYASRQPGPYGNYAQPQRRSSSSKGAPPMSYAPYGPPQMYSVAFPGQGYGQTPAYGGYSQYPQYALRSHMSAPPMYPAGPGRQPSPMGRNPLPPPVFSVFETEKFRYLARRPSGGAPDPRAHDPPAQDVEDAARTAEILASASMGQPSWPYRAAQPGPAQRIEIDGDSPLGMFSTQPVLHKGKLYPSAAHLFEAHKYIGHKNSIAESIRAHRCDPQDVSTFAAQWEGERRRDWEVVLIEKLDETLYLKFTQHAALRVELVGSGDVEIVDVSTPDAFWSVGTDGRGANNYGRALMRVRDRIRREGGAGTP